MAAAKRPKRTCKLTGPELNQLWTYLMDAERSGWYYGNHSQFRKRHENIRAWLVAKIAALK